jgi:AraC family transcriptional regulator of adaptative response/methylated-DNA-[protein]-cysteine methyltransferase
MARTPAAQPAFADDADRWAAVARRDPNANGYFFYAVTTTGVYCRPSCASRRPRREHIRFHATCEAAERAGFRPCKRCRPNEPALAERRAAAVARACRLIERAERMPRLATLARAAGMSQFHFHRVFRTITGVTPRAYAAAARAGRLRRELGRRSTVTEAIYGSGFNSNSRFYAAAPAVLGMTPTRFRAGGAGVRIHFALGTCFLGVVLVAATDKGVCAIMLGDNAAALTRDLEARFPHADFVGGDRSFRELVATVVALVETPARSVGLPLDVRGTAFQQRVWQALRDIPAGSTVSYADIARRIGAPKAVRGVARACAANPVAVVIPCHRVVRADGALAGYRWGIERKRALLDRESSHKADVATRERV